MSKSTAEIRIGDRLIKVVVMGITTSPSTHVSRAIAQIGGQSVSLIKSPYETYWRVLSHGIPTGFSVEQ